MSTVAAPNTTEHLALVSAANANQLTSALAQAAIQAAKNEDGSAKFPGFQTSQIPFGSTINVTNTGTSNLGKLAIGLLSAIGLSSALLGLIKGAIPTPVATVQPLAPTSTAMPAAAPPVAVPPAANPPPTEAAGSPMTIEGILDWELTPDGQFNTTIQPVGSAGS